MKTRDFVYLFPFRQVPFPDLLADDAVDDLEEALGAEARLVLAAVDLAGRYAVRLPVGAVVAAVEHQRLEVVQRVRETGFRAAPVFEFIEHRDELRLLVVGQQGVDALLGGVLARLLRLQALRVVGVRVAGVDFHDVVDQAHHHDLRHVHVFVGILPQQPGHDGHVPGVLGVVLRPAVAGQVRLPEDAFLLVDFQNEIQLPFQSFVHISLSISMFDTVCEQLPEIVDDEFGVLRLQLGAVLVAPGDAADAATGRAAHLQVEDGVADDQRLVRPGAEALQGQEGDVRGGFGMGDVFVGDDGREMGPDAEDLQQGIQRIVAARGAEGQREAARLQGGERFVRAGIERRARDGDVVEQAPVGGACLLDALRWRVGALGEALGERESDDGTDPFRGGCGKAQLPQGSQAALYDAFSRVGQRAVEVKKDIADHGLQK